MAHFMDYRHCIFNMQFTYFLISTSHHNEISKADTIEKDYSKEIANKNIGLKLLLQEQELRISIDPMSKTTTHELAYILKGFSQSLQEMDNITLDELEKIAQQEAAKQLNQKSQR